MSATAGHDVNRRHIEFKETRQATPFASNKALMNRHLLLLTALATASLSSCSSVSAPQADGVLGALVGNDCSESAPLQRDVRHVPPPDKPSGQLRWQMKF